VTAGYRWVLSASGMARWCECLMAAQCLEYAKF
jgi:hypothetical protein